MRRRAEALNNGVADVAKVAVDGWIKSPGHEKTGCKLDCLT